MMTKKRIMEDITDEHLDSMTKEDLENLFVEALNESSERTSTINREFFDLAKRIMDSGE
jgi:hypothetical protein